MNATEPSGLIRPVPVVVTTSTSAQFNRQLRDRELLLQHLRGAHVHGVAALHHVDLRTPSAVSCTVAS